MDDIHIEQVQAMHIGEKIRQIRVAKGLSLENVANGIGRSIAAISRFERGEVGLDDTVLAKIKKYLEIENAPLFDHELEVFRAQLWACDDLISSSREAEAKTLQDKLAVILNLPFEGEQYVMYKLIISRLLLIESNASTIEKDLNVVEENLNTAESFLSNARTNHDVSYMYYRLKGVCCMYRGDLENGLTNCLKALEHASDKADQSLLNTIGYGYMLLGKNIIAIAYFERAKSINRNWCYERENDIEIGLANCYYLMYQFDKAKEFYDSALARARANNNTGTKGVALVAMGNYYLQVGNYTEGVRYIDEAIISLRSANNDDAYLKDRHISALLVKAQCLVALKTYTGVEELLKQTEALAGGDEGVIIEIEATRHLMTLKNNNHHSAEYLERVALPYYRKKLPGGYMEALNLCDMLENHYRKKGTKRKADDIAILSRDIYRDILYR